MRHALPCLLALTLLLPGCKRDPTETGEGVADELQTIRDAMCACKDTACSSKERTRLESFVAKNAYAEGDKYARARVDRLVSELQTCERAAKLAEEVANAPPPPGFPVDRNNPPIGLAKIAVASKPADAHTLEVSFDATIHKIMANSHELKVHAACDLGTKTSKSEAAIKGVELGGTILENTTSNSVVLFADKPLPGEPKSCAVSFRVSGSPSDFERVCARGTVVAAGDCKTDTPVATE